MSAVTIEHRPAEQCFIVELQGAQARLDYQLSAAMDHNYRGLVNFSHTFVPPELRGQGLAEQLVRTGLAWAGQQQLQIQASCWYVAKFLRD